MDQPGTYFIHMFFVSSEALQEEFQSDDHRTVQAFAKKHSIKPVTLNRRDYYPKRRWLRAMLIEAGEDPTTYDQGR